MIKGKIVNIKPQKQFGFISVGKDEYFFHKDDFTGHWQDLCEDFESTRQIQVQFEADKTDKGLRARNVTRTDWPNSAA